MSNARSIGSDSMMDKIVLFISTGRTGTKSLANFFSKYFNNVESHHEPQYSRLIEILSNMYLSNIYPHKLLRKFIYKYKLPNILSCEKEYYVETNPMNYAIMDIIREIDKEVYIIHLIRDPRSYVTSCINRLHGRALSKISNRVIPFWHPNGVLTDQFKLVEWINMNDFERICWYWKYKNELILKMNKDYHNFMSIRFEDLFVTDTMNQLQSILSSVGLEFENEMVKYFDIKQNVSRKGYFPKWDRWDLKKVRELNSICSVLMNLYDYGMEEKWINKL